MKTLLTIAAAALVVSVASAQSNVPTGAPKPIPMAAPAMKVQNTQQNSSSQNSTDKKTTGTTATDSKSADSKKATPPVDNKIAVSDPGAPGDKADAKKADTKSTDKKTAPTTGVVPK
jgi:hypothetical protein